MNAAVVLRFPNIEPYLAPQIDIEEPLMIAPGTSKIVRFRYTTGNPPSFAFLIEWFLTVADADADRNPLDPTEYMLPQTRILPEIPRVGAVDEDGFVQIRMPLVDDVPNTEIETLATIDIDEPIVLQRGQSRTIDFTYTAGDPAAFAFLVEWFATEADAEAGINQLPPNLFAVVPSPATPLQTEGTHSGSIFLKAPNEPERSMYYGKISICQDTYLYIGKISICQEDIIPVQEEKRQPIGTLMPPRRRHYPTWEIR